MLFPEIVYGPIHSRRLGISLGMNLMPVNCKLCSFNCIYCECGFNHPQLHPVLPSREQVKDALYAKLATWGTGIKVVETFHGYDYGTTRWEKILILGLIYL